MKRHAMFIGQKLSFLLILGTWVFFVFKIQSIGFQKLNMQTVWPLILGLSVLCSFGFQIFLGSKYKSFWWGNLLLNFGLPVMGPFFSLCLILALVVSPKMELLSDFHEIDSSLALNKHSEDPKSYGESMRHSLNVEPLVETIRSDASTDLKRGAIEMLAKMRSPYAVSLLKECISDQNSEVRFYASSGLSRIEESLNEKIIKYKNIIKQKSEVTHQDYFLLAKAYYEFIYLSIQDEASLQYYLRQSVDNFEKAFQLNPQDINYIEELVRAYTRIGRHEDARQLKDKVHLKEHKNLMYLAESYYKEKDYRKCKEILETFAAQGLPQESSGPIAGVLSLWEIDSKTAQGGAQSYEA